ncbi:MAG TPA: hypothetical protein VLA43_13755, partial [Longimicrobiales bacterium]|nr:hypothetical protein [Longimicrobiales bacterium]
YRTTTDGAVVQRLSDVPARIYRRISLAPGGTRLVLESDRDFGCPNIWVMDTDATDPLALTQGGVERCNELPRWSPDGSYVAFTSSRNPGEWGWSAWAIHPDGTGLVHLSGSSASVERTDLVHGWTPDGRAVFHGWESGAVTTFAALPGGAGPTPLFTVPGDETPFWSPSGQKLAFVTHRDGNAEVYLADGDGSNLLNLSVNAAEDRLPAEGGAPSPWSPDGARLAFMSGRDGSVQIHVVDVGTGEVERITEGPNVPTFGGWSPDGEWIAFSAGPVGERDVYVVQADGSMTVNVTAHPADDRSPVWIRGR